MDNDHVQTVTELGLSYQESLRKEDFEWLESRGLTRQTIRSAGLGFVSSGRYTGSISIPYFLPYTRDVRTIRFRYLSPSAQKYDSFKGDNIHLYNVGNTLADKVYICEGEFDSLILNQMGYPSVGVPGANSFKPSWKYLFANCDAVNLVFDSDEAGMRGCNKIASILGDVVEEIYISRLPEGLDVTDAYVRDQTFLESLLGK